MDNVKIAFRQKIETKNRMERGIKIFDNKKITLNCILTQLRVIAARSGYLTSFVILSFFALNLHIIHCKTTFTFF